MESSVFQQNGIIAHTPSWCLGWMWKGTVMANVDITYSELTSVASLLDSSRESVLTTLATLQTRVNELTASGFRTDKASGQYEQSYQELNLGMTQAVGALEGMASFLRAVADNYQTVDADLAAGISG